MQSFHCPQDVWLPAWTVAIYLGGWQPGRTPELYCPGFSMGPHYVGKIGWSVASMIKLSLQHLSFLAEVWGASIGFPDDPTKKESACSAGDTEDAGSIPVLGGSPGGGNGKPLRYSCLKISMDRGALWATVHGVAKSQTQLSTQAELHLGCSLWGASKSYLIIIK